MFRVLMIIIVFLSCSYLGYYLGEIYRSRSLEVKELHKALNLLNSEVVFSNTAIPKALQNISTKLNEPMKTIFSQISISLEEGVFGSVYEAFETVFKENKSKLHLKEEDMNILSDFFRAFGESGVYGQERIIELTIENLSNNLREAYDEFKANTKMYRTLGLGVGAILAIFFL